MRDEEELAGICSLFSFIPHPSALIPSFSPGFLQRCDPFGYLALFLFGQLVGVRLHGWLKPVGERIIEKADDVFDRAARF
jgi:hypothetical protein